MSEPINRRDFVVGGAAVGALGAQAAAQQVGQPDAPANATRERIVHLDRLTSREVGEWMRNNDTIFVPHGPISGHGAYTTLGIHPHGAEAVATLLARKCNGLVFPP